MTIAVVTPSVDRAWVAAVLAMTRRGLSPAAVMLDAASFGGKPGAQSIVNDLANLGIPSYLIRQGQKFNTIAAHCSAAREEGLSCAGDRTRHSAGCAGDRERDAAH